MQTVRYLAQNRLGRIDLKLDRQTPYRRGEPIKVTVRFPDDAPPPAKDAEVKVVVERKLPGKDGQHEIRTIGLDRVEGSRTAYEAMVTQTPEGEYQFWLSVPAVPDPKPQGGVQGDGAARGNVRLADEPAGHGRGRRGNARQVLHPGQRRSPAGRNPGRQPRDGQHSGRPMILWNQVVFFLVALLLLSTEWLLRKRMNLL